MYGKFNKWAHGADENAGGEALADRKGTTLSEQQANLPAAVVTLVVDRAGQIVAADREGRALWRAHTQEIRELSGRVLAGGDATLQLAGDHGDVKLSAHVGQSGSGAPVVLIVARPAATEVWAAQGLMETEQHQALCRLVGGMVHELRNPLASISLTAELLGMRAGLAPEIKEKLDDVVHHVERAEEVLQNLKRFGREGQPAMRVGSLNALVEDAVRLESSGVSANHVAIRLDLAPELPLVLADASQLRLVIANLIRNAAESFDGGQQSGEIRVFTSHRHGVVRLVVEDDGPGIPAETLARIFEPYFTTKAKGTGLGLAMCAGIIKAHGGHLWAENRRQRGARFLFDLPDPQHSTPALQPTALGIELTHAPTHSALIVDQDEDRLEDSRRAIGAIGYRVHVAADPAVALRKLRASDFDVVLIVVGSSIEPWADFCSRARLAHPDIADRMAVVASTEPSADEALNLHRAGVRVAVGRHEPGVLQALARSVAEGRSGSGNSRVSDPRLLSAR